MYAKLMEKLDHISSKLDQTIAKTESMISNVERLCARLEDANHPQPEYQECAMQKKMNMNICHLPQTKYLQIGDALTAHISNPKLRHTELISCFCRHVPSEHHSIVEYITTETRSYILVYTILQFLSDQGYKVSFIKAMLDEIGLDISPIICD